MPTFRIRTRDGGETDVQAHRVRSDAVFVYAEDCRYGASPPWQVVLRLPLREVIAVQRRLDHADGRWTWISHLLQTPTGLRPLP